MDYRQEKIVQYIIGGTDGGWIKGEDKAPEIEAGDTDEFSSLSAGPADPYDSSTPEESSESSDEAVKLGIGAARRANPNDEQSILNLYTEDTYELFGDINIRKLIEHGCASFCLMNLNGEVISYVGLCDHPNLVLPPGAWEEWMGRKFNARQIHSGNALFIHLIVWDEAYFPRCITELLSQVYWQYVTLEYMVITTPPFVNTYALIESFFSRVERPRETKPDRTQNVYVNKRSKDARRVYTRAYKNEDEYDIMNMVRFQNKKLFSMYGYAMLQDVFKYLPEDKYGIVGQGSSLRDMGFLLCNTGVDYEHLREVFDLSPFNGLRSWDDGGAFLDPSINADEPTGAQEETENRQPLTGNEPVSPGSEESEESEDAYAVVEEMVDLMMGTLDEGLPHFIDEPDSAVMDEFNEKVGERKLIKEQRISSIESIKQRHCNPLILKICDPKIFEGKSPRGRGKPSAFSIEMFFLGPEQEERCCYDYILGAFNMMQNYDYCVISLPSKYQLSTLLPFFYRLRCRTGLSFLQDVYVTHRLCIFGKIVVRSATKEDFDKIVAMSRYEKNKLRIQEEAFNALYCGDKTNTVVMFTIDRKIFGFAILCPMFEYELARARFDLDELMDYDSHRGLDHGLVWHMQVSPVFVPKTRHILRETMRLTGFTSLYTVAYYKRHTKRREVTPVSGLNHWVPVTPRILPEYHRVALRGNVPPDRITAGYEAFPLYYMNPRISSIIPLATTCKIVVVGAGDTALSFLEHLIFSPTKCRRRYTNITVISPRGIPPRDLGRNTIRDGMIPTTGRYTRQYLRSLGLSTWASAVRGTVTEINRTGKYVKVNQDKTVYYDYLFLFFGEQNGPLNMKNLIRTQDCHFKNWTIKDDGWYLGQTPKNMFAINSEEDADRVLVLLKILSVERNEDDRILVYGHSLDAYACVNGLIMSGFAPEDIVLIEPFPVGKYEVEVFNNPALYEANLDKMIQLGVTVYTAFAFVDWTLSDEENWIEEAEFAADNYAVKFRCMAFFCYAPKTFHPKNFEVITNAALVYDSKLVIDREFKTNDPTVYAAGPMTKYARRYYAHNFSHKDYNSIEIGAEVAAKFRETIEKGVDPEVNSNDDYEPEIEGYNVPTVMEFSWPLVVHCKLPGNVNYLSVKRPGPLLPLETLLNHKHDLDRVLTTGSVLDKDGPGYFRILLDKNGKLMDITCYTRQEIDITNLIHLYGKHQILLNHLLMRYDAGLITDFYEYFKQPWMFFIYHDRYHKLKKENLDVIMTRFGSDPFSFMELVTLEYAFFKWHDLPQDELERIRDLSWSWFGLKAIIEENFLNFIYSNENLLTMYMTPNRLRELHEELKGSTLLEDPKDMAGVRYPRLRPNVPAKSRLQNIFFGYPNRVQFFHGTDYLRQKPNSYFDFETKQSVKEMLTETTPSETVMAPAHACIGGHSMFTPAKQAAYTSCTPHGRNESK